MKQFFLLLLFFSFETALNAQSKKILFDASKAEMAGNADWVLDADIHNIGNGNGGAMQTGQGDESNPQQFPTPAQSGISAGTAETFWKGALSAYGVDMVKQGYEVETLPYNADITYGNAGNAQDLSNYYVFVVCEPNIVFSSTEKTAMLRFVKHGGGLFIIADHDQSDRNGDGWDSPHIWNDFFTNNDSITDPFGMSFDYVDFSETSFNVAVLPNDSLLHGPEGDVSEIQFSNGTTLTLSPADNPAATGLIFKTGADATGTTDVMVARSRFGFGKVAVIGDSSPVDDGTGDPNDNLYNGWTQDANGNHEKLIVNATIWLAQKDSAIAAGVNEISFTKPFVAPNPSSGIFKVSIPASPNSVFDCELLNEVGAKVFSRQLKTNAEGEILFDLPHVHPGIYFLRLMNEVRNFSATVVIR